MHFTINLLMMLLLQVSVSLGCESRLPNMWKCVHGGGVAKLAHAMWDSWSGLLNDVRIGIEIS